MADLEIGILRSQYLNQNALGLGKGQIVFTSLVRFNAKNRLGAYVGKHSFMYVFRGNKLINVTQIDK